MALEVWGSSSKLRFRAQGFMLLSRHRRLSGQSKWVDSGTPAAHPLRSDIPEAMRATQLRETHMCLLPWPHSYPPAPASWATSAHPCIQPAAQGSSYRFLAASGNLVGVLHVAQMYKQSILPGRNSDGHRRVHVSFYL